MRLYFPIRILEMHSSVIVKFCITLSFFASYLQINNIFLVFYLLLYCVLKNSDADAVLSNDLLLLTVASVIKNLLD